MVHLQGTEDLWKGKNSENMGGRGTCSRESTKSLKQRTSFVPLPNNAIYANCKTDLRWLLNAAISPNKRLPHRAIPMQEIRTFKSVGLLQTSYMHVAEATPPFPSLPKAPDKTHHFSTWLKYERGK